MRQSFINAFRGGAKLAARNARLLANSNPLPTSMDFFIASNTFTSVVLRFPVGKSITVHWGDDSSTVYNGNDETNVTIGHTYASAGSYQMTLEGDFTELTYIKSTYKSMSGDISGWSVLTNIEEIELAEAGVTGDISGWSAMTKARSISLDATLLTGDLSSWSALTNLEYVKTRYCNTTGDLSGWSALTKLEQIHFQLL